MKIDTIEISEDFIWENEFENDVRSVVMAAVGGGKAVFEDAGNLNPNIDLIGGVDFACLTRAQRVALEALANVPGGTYTLDYNGWVSHEIRFRNEDKKAIEGTPMKEKPSDQYYDGDFYNNVKIKLMKVG